MDREGVSCGGPCYYSVLGLRKDASFCDVKAAYRRHAMKWHPDKWGNNPQVSGEAKRRFQQIQEAYSVLSDQSKRSLYDAGLYDPLEEEDEDFCDFMQEMITTMNSVKDEGDTFEDLQMMFMEMVGGDAVGFDHNIDRVAHKRQHDNVTAMHGGCHRQSTMPDPGPDRRTPWQPRKALNPFDLSTDMDEE